MKPLKERVTEKLAERLPSLTPAQRSDLQEQAEEFFKSCTRRIEVPERAFWTLVDLACALYKDSQSDAVTSVKRGDTTIQYAEKGAVSAMLPRIYAYRVAVAR